MYEMQIVWFILCVAMMCAAAYIKNWMAFGAWLFAAACEGQILGLLAR